MMVLDTHIWVGWILGGDVSLPPQVAAAMRTEDRLAVSSISCFEVALLVKRKRLELPLSTKEWLEEALGNSGVEPLPVTCEIVRKAVELSDVHRDPADRIIIATALAYGARLASEDALFQDYKELASVLVGK
jgi:PIN domain nuclease of toxin-antitoxin system